jgi:hypothetical protein
VIKSILILGGGSAGLLTAIRLKGRLPAVNVTVLQSKDIGIIGVGEGTNVSVPEHLQGYLGLVPVNFCGKPMQRLSWGFDFSGAKDRISTSLSRKGSTRGSTGLPSWLDFYFAEDMTDGWHRRLHP